MGIVGEVRFSRPRISALLQIQRVLSRGRAIGTCGTIAPVIMLGITSYRRSEEDERRILRCAACDGTVFGEIAGFVRADANTACASCGMTLVDSPFSGGDYFDVIMRVGRPIWRGARLRRAG